MPSSHYFQLNEIVDLIFLTNPQKLLDIGIGFGKYGFLAREYLELWVEGGEYGKWKRVIDGIEAFEQYITPVHKAIYNNIFTGNALDILPTLHDRYDLILMIDVFEHFSYEDGLKVLETCRQKGRNIIISVPAQMSLQEEVFGNPYETHRYSWQKKDFSGIREKFYIRSSRSIICFIGEDAERIRKIIQKRKFHQFLVFLLDFIHLKRPLKVILGRK